MDEIRLNELMLETFPELAEQFETYVSWQDGMETGCFLTYEDLLLPTLIGAFKGSDITYIKRGCEFIEQLITSSDEYARNLANVGLLEGLKAHLDDAIVRPFLGPISLKEFDTMVV